MTLRGGADAVRSSRRPREEACCTLQGESALAPFWDASGAGRIAPFSLLRPVGPETRSYRRSMRGMGETANTRVYKTQASHELQIALVLPALQKI